MFLKILIKQDTRGAESNSLEDYSNLDNPICSLRLCSQLACEASVSVRFRSKERGTRVKDRAKNGVSKRAGRGLFHFSRGQNRGSIERGGRAILKIMQHAGRFKKNYPYIEYQWDCRHRDVKHNVQVLLQLIPIVTFCADNHWFTQTTENYIWKSTRTHVRAERLHWRTPFLH